MKTRRTRPTSPPSNNSVSLLLMQKDKAVGDDIGSAPWVTVAHLLRPQGRKGELLAELLTDFPQRFADHPQVFLRGPAEFDEPRPATVESHWLPVGRNAGRIVLQLTGVDSIESAEALSGTDVLIPAADRLPLEDGSMYISDLVGCTVSSAGKLIGVIESVEFATTPDGSARISDAAPILVVRTPDGNEAMVPFVRAYLTHIDLQAKSIAMDLPDGLLDLN